MIPVYLLENNDVIQANDFVRQLSLTFDGQSDYLETTSTYSGSRVNRTGWMRAEEVCPYWVGKKVGAFNKGMDFKHRHKTEVSAYEFIRGDIPQSHWEPGEIPESSRYVMEIMKKGTR